MAFGMMALSNAYSLRDTSVEIVQAINGYIFKLSGTRKIKIKKKKDFYNEWENFETQYVYQNLEEGLKEVEGFFKLIAKELNIKVKKEKKK